MVLALNANIFSQSGFLGSTVNFNAQLEVVPVFSTLYSENYSNYKRIDSSLLKFKKTFVDFKFSFSGSKVINDDLEIGVVFNYSSFGIIADQFSGIDTNFLYYGYTLQEIDYSMLNVLKAKSSGLSVNIKRFNRGLAPIGGYIGLNVGYNRTTTKKDAEVLYGDKNLLSSKFLYKTYEVMTSKSTTLDYRAKVGSFNVNFLMGRTIPVSEKLGIDLSMSIPVFRILSYNGIKAWAFLLKDSNTTISSDSANQLNKAIGYSVKRNQGFSLNAGLKYFI